MPSSIQSKRPGSLFDLALLFRWVTHTAVFPVPLTQSISPSVVRKGGVLWSEETHRMGQVLLPMDATCSRKSPISWNASTPLGLQTSRGNFVSATSGRGGRSISQTRPIRLDGLPIKPGVMGPGGRPHQGGSPSCQVHVSCGSTFLWFSTSYSNPMRPSQRRLPTAVSLRSVHGAGGGRLASSVATSRDVQRTWFRWRRREGTSLQQQACGCI